MRDVEELRVPHTIVAAGQNLLQSVATRTICAAVTGDSGNDHLMSFRVIGVPGLGSNLFSVTAAMLKWVATLFHPTDPRLEKDGVVAPILQLGVDDTTGKVMYSIKVKLGSGAGDQMVLGDNPDGLAESANLWHRRKGHCLLYTSPSPRDGLLSRMPSSA